MKSSRAIALAAATLILGFFAARWYNVQSPRPQGNDTSRLSGSENPMAKMMKDPAVTTVVQDMEAQFVKRDYAALVKQLDLPPEQADAFYGLLLNHEKNQEAAGFQLLSGTNSTDASRASPAAQETLDDQVRSLLGEKGYAQYKVFKAGMSDRKELERMQKDFADAPLNDAQQQRLLQVIKAKQQATPIPDSPDFNSKTPSRENMVALMTQLMKRQSDIDQEVLQEAGDFLSPAQIHILGTSQSNRLNFQKMTMTMAQKMFDGAVSNAAPARR